MGASCPRALGCPTPEEVHVGSGQASFYTKGACALSPMQQNITLGTLFHLLGLGFLL